MPIKREFYYKPIIDFLKKSNGKISRDNLYIFIIENFGVKEPRKIITKLKQMGYIKEHTKTIRTIDLIKA
jgi:hypothetical protein